MKSRAGGLRALVDSGDGRTRLSAVTAETLKPVLDGIWDLDITADYWKNPTQERKDEILAQCLNLFQNGIVANDHRQFLRAFERYIKQFLRQRYDYAKKLE